MSAELLAVLIRTMLAGSVAIALVLALRIPVRRYFGPRLAYALWLAVPLLPLASLLPAPGPAPIVVRLTSHDRAVAAPAAAPKIALPIDTAAWWLELWLLTRA